MTRRGKLARALGTALLAALLLAPEAGARAGGGSFGFGGGGGGGRGLGGLGRGFSHGHFFFIPIGGGGGGGLLLLIVVAVIVFFVLPRLMMWWRSQQNQGTSSSRKVAKRSRRVELAAAEAAEDDPAFSPDVLKPAAAKLFLDVQQAWDAADRLALRSLVAPELLEEWERRLDDLERRGWRNRVRPLEEPQIDLVGLRNLGGETGDRVTVRIQTRMSDYVEDAWGQRIRRTDAFSDISRVREFWTLGKRDGHWILMSIEQGAEGAHALDEEIVASPWADERSLRDEALVEGAVADAVPEGTNIAELADLDFRGDGRAAANDLSLVDGRFAPALLEVAARRAVAAWAEAVDGSDTALRSIAHPDAMQELLYPGDPSRRARLVVRGLQIRHIEIASLNAASRPPQMTIEVNLNGRRYTEDRDTTAILQGSQSHATSFTEHWTLSLDGDEHQPWRIASVQRPLVSR